MNRYSSNSGKSVQIVLACCLVAVVSMLLGWTLAKRYQQGTSGPAAEMRGGAVPGAMAARPDAEPSSVRVRPRPQTGNPVPDSADGALSLKPGTPMLDPAQLSKQRERMAAELEQGHRAEPMDAAWAAQAEPALEKMAASPDLAVAAIQVDGLATDCRSKTCRISASFDSVADAEQWGMLFATGTGKTLRQTRSVVVPLGNGKSELRIYGLRR